MRIIPFSKYFLPTVILSVFLIAAGLAGYVIFGGFNLGIDFQAGLIQEVQFAPTAFTLSYQGLGNASINLDRNGIRIVLSGSGVEGRSYEFPYDRYAAVGDLSTALSQQIDGLRTVVSAPENTPAGLLVQSAQGNPQLGADPFRVHYIPAAAPSIAIEEVRGALESLGTVSVQVLGQSRERRFMIRMEDKDGGIPADQIIAALESRFGEGGVAVTRADYVGSRFSKQLTDQAGILMALTLVLILIYASVRFKPQYAIGAVLAIAHDALIIVAFVAWTRMEFNTITIASILTILGYSINDTIVIFDRIRETRRIYPDDDFRSILDRAISETLSRTIITTLTTMLAVVSLYIFTTGSMKVFALCLIIGMISGVYSTIFIASGFVFFWDKTARKRALKKQAGAAPAPAKA
ncbi:MAG: protein translocase subunit SecF [Treponema sp.]|jgi:preprotein translocase subunit SecF|nr:protein translocase subunit SecF [Treponema sp.]